jgi:hypothetical protein
MEVEAPEPDPEAERQEKAAKLERVRTVQEDLTKESEDLTRIFGRRAGGGRGAVSPSRAPSSGGLTSLTRR